MNWSLCHANLIFKISLTCKAFCLNLQVRDWPEAWHLAEYLKLYNVCDGAQNDKSPKYFATKVGKKKQNR